MMLLKKKVANNSSGMTLIEVAISMMISTTLILGVGQIMKSTFSSLNYVANQSISISQSSSLKTSLQKDVVDSEVIIVSNALYGIEPNLSDECSTVTLGTSGNGGTGTRSVLPLFSAFANEMNGRDLKSMGLSHGVGYEVRTSEDKKSGELWRVQCDLSTNNETLETTWKVNPLKSSRLVSRVALPYEIVTPSSSKWFPNSVENGLYGLGCVAYNNSSKTMDIVACVGGFEYDRKSSQSSNGIRGLVLKLWAQNGDLSGDYVVARRL
jgi:hypothetical protein